MTALYKQVFLQLFPLHIKLFKIAAALLCSTYVLKIASKDASFWKWRVTKLFSSKTNTELIETQNNITKRFILLLLFTQFFTHTHCLN